MDGIVNEFYEPVECSALEPDEKEQITKNYYDNSSYRWAVINAGVSGAMLLLTILEVLTTCFWVVI